MANGSDLENNKGDKSMDKAKDSKEFTDIFKAIGKWVKAQNNNVSFIGAFLSYDKEEELKDKKDNRVVLYGHKSGLEEQIEDIKRAVKEESDDSFINV
jgi:hypothetical protein